MTPRRAFLTGILAGPVLFLVLVAASVPFWPDWPILGEAARILDSAVPQIILAGMAGVLGLWLMRAPRGLVALAAIGLLGAAALLVTRHVANSLPLVAEQPADVTLLWFNVLNENDTDPARLAQALIDSPADIVILGEAESLASQQEALARAFPVRAGCGDGQDTCQMMVLARRAAATVAFRRIGRLQEPRLAVVSVTPDAGPPFTVIGMHLLKPWFRGFVEGEDWQTVHALRDVSGPLVAVGDLNAAPWSRRVQTLATRCGMMSARLPPPTWPIGAGWLGVPIDHVLVRGGARLTSLETWGSDLGSNHLGLLAGVALPDASATDPAPKTCRPPRSRWDKSLQ